MRSKQTSLKRDKEKDKLRKKKEKEERKLERKTNSNKGKGFDSMIAYVDENGQLSSTPPDPSKRKELVLEDIQLGARKPVENDENYVAKGRVSYYNDEKGYGFIKDDITKESLFFHLNALHAPVKVNDHVTFEKTQSLRGLSAIDIRIID